MLSTAAEAQSDLIPRSVLFDLSERKERFALSPEGDQVYYVKNPYVPGNILYARDIVQGKETPLTFDHPFVDYRLFPGGRILLNFRTTEAQYFGLYDRASKKLLRLEPGPINRSKIYDVSLDLEAAVAILIMQNGEKGIYRFTLDNEWTRIRDPEGFLELYFDASLNPVAGLKPNEQQANDLYYLKDDTWRQLRRHDWYVDMFIGGVNQIVSVSDDGNQIYFTDNSHTDRTQLVVLDRATGAEQILLPPGPADVLPTSMLFDEEGRPVSAVQHFGTPRRTTWEARWLPHIDLLEDRLSELHILDVSADRSTWLVEDMNGGANRYYRYDTTDRSLTFLFTDFPAFAKYPSNLRTSAIVTSFDGLNLPVQVYLREDLDTDRNGIPDRPLPTILYVHGGPWIGWLQNSWFTTRNLELLANRGYAVIHTEFRGASTYGKAFVEASNKQWGDGMMRDHQAVVEWAIDQGIADPEKVGIYGWSFGGYAAMAGLTFAPDTYACGVAMYGIADLDSFLRTDFANNRTWRERVADIRTKEGEELAYRHSPINYVDKIQAPLFLTTGGKDQRVPHDQSDRMAEAMHEAGKEVTYLYYPEEGHDYRLADNWITFWRQAESFLHQHLGGEYQPIETGEAEIYYKRIYPTKNN